MRFGGRAAAIAVASILFVMGTAVGGADAVAKPTKAAKVTVVKKGAKVAAKPGARLRHAAHRKAKTSTTASLSSRAKIAEKAARAHARLREADAEVALPPQVANANASMVQVAQATDAVLSLPPLSPRPDAPPSADRTEVTPEQVASERPVEKQDKAPASQTVARATTSPAVAASDNSAWSQTSLVGKIFLAFGALLTIGSAARLFMA